MQGMFQICLPGEPREPPTERAKQVSGWLWAVLYGHCFFAFVEKVLLSGFNLFGILFCMTPALDPKQCFGIS